MTDLGVATTAWERRQLAYGSFVSLRHRLLYVAVPKAACTAMKRLLAELEGERLDPEALDESWEVDPGLQIHCRGAWRTPSLVDLDPERAREALTSPQFLRLAVVRNPFTRAFSAWQSKVLLREPLQIGPYRGKEFDLRGIRDAGDVRAAFEGFLEHLAASERLEGANPHWALQSSVLLLGRVGYTFVGKAEEMAATAAVLREHLERQNARAPELTLENRGLLGWDPAFLTPRAERLVRELYAPDFRAFGYAPEPPPRAGEPGVPLPGAAARAVEMIRARHERFAQVRARLDRVREQLEAAAQERESARSELASRRESALVLEGRIADLERLVLEEVARHEAARASLAEREARLGEQGALLGEREAQIERLRKELAAAAAERGRLVHESRVMRGSLSWRMTAPLRRLADLLLPRVRAEVHRRTVRESGLFDAAWYLRENPDVARSGIDPLRHFLCHGSREGRRPSPLFDPRAYLAANPDVLASGLDPLVHYLRHGAAEGRDPGAPLASAGCPAGHAGAAPSGEGRLPHRRGERAPEARPAAGDGAAELHRHYDARFYREQVEGSARSARVVVPLVLELLGPVDSVIDVGCGTGAWLRQFERHGVADVTGVDGGGVEEDLLQIPARRLRRGDLSQPLAIGRRFGLCISLEVAEHLPPERADSFVDDLCGLADVVVFGAAVPGQGGQSHLNERWPSYWAQLFLARGFRPFDAIRPRVWNDSRVEWWYAQNTLVYVREERRDLRERLAAGEAPAPLDLVHPRLLDHYGGVTGWPKCT